MRRFQAGTSRVLFPPCELEMKTFHCDVCGSLVFFENVTCVHCGHSLGFLPDALDLSAVEPEAENTIRALSLAARNGVYRTCANGRQHAVCNWLVPESDPSELCRACTLNSTIPNALLPPIFGSR